MSALPVGFAELEPWVAKCALATAPEREALRGAMPEGERHAFHAAVTPRLADALALLDATPLSRHDAAQTNLMRLLLAYPHIAQAVEVQGPDEARHARARIRIPFTRATADL